MSGRLLELALDRVSEFNAVLDALSDAELATLKDLIDASCRRRGIIFEDVEGVRRLCNAERERDLAEYEALIRQARREAYELGRRDGYVDARLDMEG